MLKALEDKVSDEEIEEELRELASGKIIEEDDHLNS